jgi:hypothetical protein
MIEGSVSGRPQKIRDPDPQHWVKQKSSQISQIRIGFNPNADPGLALTVSNEFSIFLSLFQISIVSMSVVDLDLVDLKLLASLIRNRIHKIRTTDLAPYLLFIKKGQYHSII